MFTKEDFVQMEEHFPFLFRLQDILFRPDLFLFVEIRYPFLFFIERCIEYREMNIALYLLCHRHFVFGYLAPNKSERN